ncbi:YaaC family protein [Aquibacillus albus]|uniref:YaaC family protein n=1 Tax=Aquibacillus albus TaxID=1168171 RepID=A0ABS2N327_9BACI|nr:YaaC family protein [Aquibacillus albus]MBM7572507.1 hypothetical protein [Aquibacillus albus]
MIEKDIELFLGYLTSAHTSQKFLDHCYKKNEVPNPSKHSFENSYRFLYYLQHGLQFFESGNQGNVTVKPIMYFYGMVHLLKACILTQRPKYPENTAMLAHGVSTRKRKKQDYSFLQDEVKVQFKGLFPYFCNHLFHVEQFPFDKTNMEQLLATIPELNDLFYFHRGQKVLEKISSFQDTTVTIPITVLDHYHMTESAFLTKISNYLPKIINKNTSATKIELTLSHTLSPSSQGPFYFHVADEAFYLPIKRHHFSITHEVMNHYLLLYNLSMICRYETEWWGDLLYTLPTEDYPFIKQFLSVTATKIPFLLGYFLYQQKE